MANGKGSAAPANADMPTLLVFSWFILLGTWIIVLSAVVPLVLLWIFRRKVFPPYASHVQYFKRTAYMSYGLAIGLAVLSYAYLTATGMLETQSTGGGISEQSMSALFYPLLAASIVPYAWVVFRAIRALVLLRKKAPIPRPDGLL